MLLIQRQRHHLDLPQRLLALLKNLIPNTSPPTYLLNASTKNVAIAALANAPMARIPLGALYVNNVKITKTKNKK